MIEKYLKQITASLLVQDVTEIVDAAEILRSAWENDASVWIVGNGGSASTAGHFANDLVKMAGVNAFSVSDMTSVMMAYGNDDGWENMFSHALESLMRFHDVLVAISCGGMSRNVIEAAKLFRPSRLIILTGNRSDTPLAQMEAGAKIHAMVEDIRIQEDIHLIACHLIAGILAERNSG
jgi:D-sedoheptulose 7-phosphate isomerase